MEFWHISGNQVTRALENQSFVTLTKKSNAEATVRLEEQICSYQCSVEAAIRSLANVSCTLTKQAATQGQYKLSTRCVAMPSLMAARCVRVLYFLMSAYTGAELSLLSPPLSERGRYGDTCCHAVCVSADPLTSRIECTPH